MHFIVFFLIFLTVLSIEANVPNLWPLPAIYSLGTTKVPISPDFQFKAVKPHPDLDLAFERYTKLIYGHHISDRKFSTSNAQQITSLSVTVKDTGAVLSTNVDEEYTLECTKDSTDVTLIASTIFGALHGIETFSQLIRFDFSLHNYQLINIPFHIQDKPRFPHRGLMIDTSRHYQPLPAILLLIDSMSYSKLNVLHWHLIDSQSFPMESISYPKLWNGAYSDTERYTMADLSYVVEYAKRRGIRVYPEIDIPGHNGGFCAGYPDVCPSASCKEPLDPSSTLTFELLKGLFNDLHSKFDDNYFHLGGDEVGYTCWSLSPDIQKWMKEKNYTNEDTYLYFVSEAAKLIIDSNHSPIHWEEVFVHFKTKLDKKTIVHVWKSVATIKEAVTAGYKTLVSNSDKWYLDHLALTWKDFYSNEPCNGFEDKPSLCNLVIGGETCMWGETVDLSDLFNTVYPRASAAAERLWTPLSLINEDAALERLEWFRCWIMARGIPSGPVKEKGRAAPPRPGSCIAQ